MEHNFTNTIDALNTHRGQLLAALAKFQLHPDGLQQQVSQRVGAVKLEHHVAWEHMLLAGHRVLRFGH